MAQQRGGTGAAATQARVAALEEGYANLGREIHGLRNDFQAFAREVRGELTTRGRTQWAPIIAGASLVVAILGGLITLGAQGPLRELSRHEQALSILGEARHQDNLDTREWFRGRLDRVFDRINTHEHDGHAERVETLERDIRALWRVLEARTSTEPGE